MADKDTLALDEAAALTGDEWAHIVQDGESVKTQLGDIAALAGLPGSVFGAKWELAFSWNWSANVTEVVADNLGDYKELIVICRDITASASLVRLLRVSTDNGATWWSTTADYQSIANTGVITGRDNAAAHAVANAAARTIFAMIRPNIAGTPKLIYGPEFATLFVGSLNPINAVRLLLNGVGNITGGSMFVLGLR